MVFPTAFQLRATYCCAVAHQRHADEAVASQEVRPGGDARLSTTYFLSPAVPNPASEGTDISFGIPERSYVELSVYDLRGRLVTTLVDEAVSPGSHTVSWDGHVPSGVYFCRMTAVATETHREVIRVGKILVAK